MLRCAHTERPEEGIGSLELDLQEIVSCPVWVLRIELWSSAKAASMLTIEQSLWPPLGAFEIGPLTGLVSSLAQEPPRIFLSLLLQHWIISLCHHGWLCGQGGVLLFSRQSFYQLILPWPEKAYFKWLSHSRCSQADTHSFPFWLSLLFCFSGQEHLPFCEPLFSVVS